MATSRRFLSLASASVLAAALLVAPASRAAEPLLLQWGTIDTSSADAQAESAALKATVAKKAAAARRTAAAETRAAYVVQFPGPVLEEWRVWLESATQVRGYLPEFAYLVWATPSEMDAIAANENVFWTGEWKKDYKTVCAETAPAKTTASTSITAPRQMHVMSLLAGDAGTDDLQSRLEALGAIVDDAFTRLDGSAAVAWLTDKQIDEVSDWPDIEWIEPCFKARLFNDQAARTNMMNVSNVWKSLSSGGLGLTGTNQIVAVADTGCDTGNPATIHPDFAGRILAGYGWTNGSYVASCTWNDTDAHGTHVCGSVLGNGAASTNKYRGMAYEAKLVMQGLSQDDEGYLVGLPNDTKKLLNQAYTNGARIHSDSWGGGTAGAYSGSAVYSDTFLWTNQNFIMIVAAGNEGIDANSDGVIDPTSVSAPGTAKNCITVGASENYRSISDTWGDSWPDDYPADPIKSDDIVQTSTPQGLAAFSSRGPTSDGRIKPDIVAPGTYIISTRSRNASSTGWGKISGNTNYIYEGGTSMATPLTSGATALVRQWLVERKGISDPMAALMKALLINGARDMTPGQYGTGATQEITARPDRSQGFGHVNLYNSLEPGAGNFLVFVTNKLTTSANFTTNIAVGQANAGTYILTLVWQDYPGASGGSKNLVNDLDLTVTSPSGTVYYPNNLSGLDHTNNVEFIEFTAAETGTYAVKVNGYSVSKTSPHGGQPFALVMRGPETATDPVPPTFSSATSATNGVQFEYIEFTFSSLLTAGYPTPTYHLTTTVSTNEFDFDDATGYLLFSPQSYGTFTFKCVASNENGTATNTLTVTVTQAPPAVPADLALSDVDATSFTASWSAAANAESYRLDVVQGDSFETAVGGAVLEADFSDTTGWTLSGTGTYTGFGYYGEGSPSIKFDHTGDYAISPDFGSGVKLRFWAFGNNGSGSTFAIAGLVNGTWGTIETVSIAQGGDTYEVTLPSGTSQVRFDFTKSVNCALDDVVVYGPGAEAGEYVPGWSNATVNATSANVTGLQPSTTYAVRVRAVNGGGTSANSAVATATTAAGVSAPVWAAFPATVVDVGTNCWLDIASYASGSPAPAVTLVSSTADSGDYEFEDGYLMFAPPAGDTYTFTFAASNSAGTSNATLAVTGNVEAPSIAAIADRAAVVGDTNIAFFVSASGIPAPVLSASASANTTAGDWDFDSGEAFFYFIPSGTGDYTFTVTATNIAGSASESFTVTVNPAPVTVPTLTVADIAATSALATWTACDNVSSYTLQLASDDQFTTGGSGGTVTLFSNDGTDATAPAGWSYEIESAAAKSGLVLKNDDYVISESVDASACTALSLSLEIRTYGGSSGTSDTLLVQYSADDGTSWNNVGTITATGKTLAAADPIDVSAAAGNTAVRLRFTDPGASSSQGVGIAYLVLTGTESASGGSLIATETVGDTSFAFTGLAPETTYCARVKGTNDWSNVAEFTTQSAGDSAPVWSASFPSAATANVGDPYELATLSSYVSGSPSPVITLTAPAGVTASYENDTFRFSPSAAGDYTFTFTASNSVGTADATLVVTASAPPVTVPTLAVTNVTDTTALASWTACDNVSSYTLQLATNDFPAASSAAVPRSLTTLLEETFTKATGTSGITDFDGTMDNPGWEGSYVFANNGAVRLSSGSGSGELVSPWLTNATAGASVRVVFSSVYWTNDLSSLVVDITEDDDTYTDATTFELSGSMVPYTNTFTVTSTRFRVRWTPSANKKRFFLDNVAISASGGDTPAGDDIQTFTVADTSHTFTNLTPETTYYARVKGEADWSPVVSFATVADTPSTPFEDWLAEHGASGHDATDTASDGEHSYYDYFLADIDPASTDFLEVSFAPAADGTLTINHLSSNRTYQLLYWADLLSSPVTNDLDPANLVFPTNATGFGRIRVTLPDP